MKNEFLTTGELTEIYAIYKGKKQIIKVDTEDLDIINKVGGSWFIHPSPSKNVLYAVYRRREGKKIVEWYLMHRLIIDALKNQIVDHIDGNGLDNRKCNLRFVSRKENGQNRTSAQSNSKSGVLGVHWNKRKKKWESGIRVDGKRINLGSFDSSEEAKEMVDLARAKYMTHSKEAGFKDLDFSKLIKTGMEPQGTNKSGYRYVNWSKKQNKWFVQMWVQKKRYHFGCFDKLEDARRVALEMKQKYKP